MPLGAHFSPQPMNRRRSDLFANVRRELALAIRALRRAPGFSTIALVTLALGIGATAAIFCVLNAIVLRPLQYRNPEGLVSVLHPTTVPGTGESRWGLSAAGYFNLRSDNRTLVDLGVYTTSSVLLTGDGVPEMAPSGSVSASIFSVLEARAALGRLISPDDDVPGTEPVVMLGHSFWRQRFGSDSSIVGKHIAINGEQVRVIGVAE